MRHLGVRLFPSSYQTARSFYTLVRAGVTASAGKPIILISSDELKNNPEAKKLVEGSDILLHEGWLRSRNKFLSDVNVSNLARRVALEESSYKEYHKKWTDGLFWLILGSGGVYSVGLGDGLLTLFFCAVAGFGADQLHEARGVYNKVHANNNSSVRLKLLAGKIANFERNDDAAGCLSMVVPVVLSLSNLKGVKDTLIRDWSYQARP